jgi:hypothetical protein
MWSWLNDAITTNPKIALQIDETWGPEVDAPDLLSFDVETLPVVVTRKDLSGATIEAALADP